jgi:hypothetical protein
MKRFLACSLLPMMLFGLLLPLGCANKLPTEATGAVAATSPGTQAPVTYKMTEYWYIYNQKTNTYIYYPWGLSLSNGNLFVDDAIESTLTKMSATGQPTSGGVGTFSTQVTSGLSGPYGNGMDSKKNVYVPNGSDYNVVIYDYNGVLLGHFGQYGTSGTNGNFRYPIGVTVDSKGNIYVLDYYTGIQKFDSNYKYLTSFGGGVFDEPLGGMATDGTNIYVADLYHYDVKKFGPNGQSLGQFGSYGTGQGQFEYPTGVALDQSGNIYVADYYTGVQKFSSSFAFESAVAPGYSTTHSDYLAPFSVAVDTNGIVYDTNYYYYMAQFTPSKLTN